MFLTEPAPTPQIPKGSTNDHNFYAKWNILKFSDYDNTDKLSSAIDDIPYEVTLRYFAFYKDSCWNTLCLPFDIDNFEGTPLQGATVMTIESSSFNDGILTMNFSNVNTIEAGKPYIVKWGCVIRCTPIDFIKH